VAEPREVVAGPLFEAHMCPLKPAVRSSAGQLRLDAQGTA
jgi:hypothetical protein